MIERKFVNQNIKEFEIKEYVRNNLQRVGLSDVKLQRTPLGEKIVISTSRPGLVVGRSGTNITKLTKDLKEVFKLENPQIEIDEITSIGLDANIIAEMIANSLERFGISRFKGIAHKAMSDVLSAGAFGVEILIAGKVPSSRAKTWRFYQGYLKKCGDIAVSKIRVSYAAAKLKSGVVGVKVSIMTPDTVLPDKIKMKSGSDEMLEKSEGLADDDVQVEMQEKIKEMLPNDESDSGEPEAKDGKSASNQAKGKQPKKKKASSSSASKSGSGRAKATKKEPGSSAQTGKTSQASKKKDDTIDAIKSEPLESAQDEEPNEEPGEMATEEGNDNEV
ncbi:30S ribosomal protein S3 [Candidatus Woesearchaeota archaeon]|nr:30S ribosomal protein S3 [Candidatus Woesearchaeota archaeon]